MSAPQPGKLTLLHERQAMWVRRLAVAGLVGLLLLSGGVTLVFWLARRGLRDFSLPFSLSPPPAPQATEVRCDKLAGPKGGLMAWLPPLRVLEDDWFIHASPAISSGVNPADLTQMEKTAKAWRREGEEASHQRLLEQEEAMLQVTFQKKAAALARQLKRRREQWDKDLAPLKKKRALVRIELEHVEKTLRATPWLQQPPGVQRQGQKQGQGAAQYRQRHQNLSQELVRMNHTILKREKAHQRALEAEQENLLVQVERLRAKALAELRRRHQRPPKNTPEAPWSEVETARRLFATQGRVRLPRPLPVMEDHASPSRLAQSSLVPAFGGAMLAGAFTFRECFWAAENMVKESGASPLQEAPRHD